MNRTIRLIVILAIFCLCNVQVSAQSDGDAFDTDKGKLIVQPILHATMVLQWDGKVIYVDPYGGKSAFAGTPKADLVLITDIHGDHMNIKTLEELGLSGTKIVAPSAVLDKLPEGFTNTIALGNGSEIEVFGMNIMAIPMYNLPETEESRHPKGRGNGYVINFGGKKVYISGDTEDIPEMRSLQDIDIAFVCMNLPYTMDVETAADAVLDFEPRTVFPFHYRGKNGLGDVGKFKKIVNEGNGDIEVRLRQWYPSKDE